MPAPLRFIPPMERLGVHQIREGELLQSGLKLDGYRAIAIKQNGQFVFAQWNVVQFQISVGTRDSQNPARKTLYVDGRL